MAYLLDANVDPAAAARGHAMTPIWAGSRFPVVTVSRVVEIQLGKMLQPARDTMVDQLTPYLRAGSLSELDTDDFPEMFASPLDRKKYGVDEGDLLVAEGGDVGRAEFARTVPTGTIIQNSLHRLRSKAADIRFVKYCLDAAYASSWLGGLLQQVHLRAPDTREASRADDPGSSASRAARHRRLPRRGNRPHRRDRQALGAGQPASRRVARG